MRLCAARIGKKIHRPKNPALQLKAVLVDEAIPVFDFILRNAGSLESFRREVPQVGTIVDDDIQHPGVDLHQMNCITRELLQKASEPMRRILSIEGRRVIDLVEGGAPLVRLSNSDWITLVFDMIKALQQTSRENQHLFGLGGPGRTIVALLHPFYLARVIDLVLQTERASDEEMETLIRENAAEFSKRRPELERGLQENPQPIGLRPL
jgi:hypothetical protein